MFHYIHFEWALCADWINRCVVYCMLYSFSYIWCFKKYLCFFLLNCYYMQVVVFSVRFFSSNECDLYLFLFFFFCFGPEFTSISMLTHSNIWISSKYAPLVNPFHDKQNRSKYEFGTNCQQTNNKRIKSNGKKTG